MSKPDWATRLQRTFARKYDAGFAKGLMLGKAVATRDEQERIIGLIEEYFPVCDCKEYEPQRICIHRNVALELATLIKGEN